MATWGEYSSLLQLGVGLGIGLSLFRAPVDLRVSKMEARIDNEIAIRSHIDQPSAKESLQRLSSIRLDFAKQKILAEKWLVFFLAASLLGAAANLGALICASRDAQITLTGAGELSLIALSVAYYLVILLILEVLARFWFASTGSALKEFDL